jgi:hypothetical protein
VSESEAADTVPPLRLLYSGRRRTLNFNRIEWVPLSWRLGTAACSCMSLGLMIQISLNEYTNDSLLSAHLLFDTSLLTKTGIMAQTATAARTTHRARTTAAPAATMAAAATAGGWG